MPILFVHGVNVRDRSLFLQIEPMLRRHLAPVMSSTPEAVAIDDAYWGDLGVRFAWGGASRPASQILAMGAETQQARIDAEHLQVAIELSTCLDATGDPVPGTSVFVGRGGTSTCPSSSGRRLSALSDDMLSDLLCAALDRSARELTDQIDPEAAARAKMAADDLAHDQGFRAKLARAPDRASELGLVAAELEKTEASSPLLGMGGKRSWTDLKERVGEALDRIDDLPVAIASTALLETRKWAHDFISQFVGDVVEYVRSRDMENPGPIVGRVLDKLRLLSRRDEVAAGEPIVVLTHSMGGQIVYDALTSFLPVNPEDADVKVDFWCASASQVGFFEEAKFHVLRDDAYHTNAPAPFPPRLGTWWNVWDPNDVLSFTARGIFSGVDDQLYWSGMPVSTAHGGYLARPGFFRLFAEKLATAKAKGFRR